MGGTRVRSGQRSRETWLQAIRPKQSVAAVHPLIRIPAPMDDGPCFLWTTCSHVRPSQSRVINHQPSRGTGIRDIAIPMEQASDLCAR